MGEEKKGCRVRNTGKEKMGREENELYVEHNPEGGKE